MWCLLFRQHREEPGPGSASWETEQERRPASVTGAASERDGSLRFEVRILNTFPPGELVLQGRIN